MKPSMLASSSGRILFQIPSFPRKVPSPDSAEIPAPVKTAILDAPSSARLALSDSVKLFT